MALDLIVQPFANSGDQTTPPQTDASGFVNFTQGYTPDYELNLASGNAQAKAIERRIQNYLFNQAQSANQTWMQQGFAPWFAGISGGYAKNARVMRQVAGVWTPFRSLIANNVSDPNGNPAQWEYERTNAEMLLSVPMQSGGNAGPSAELITASINFNTYLGPGTWQVQTDALMAASTNAPGGVAGLLEAIEWLNSATTYAVQRFTDRNGNQSLRGYTNGTWTSWIQYLTQTTGDLRYAKLAGLSTQVFAVANPTLPGQAVNVQYGDARYAALAGNVAQAFAVAPGAGAQSAQFQQVNPGRLLRTTIFANLSGTPNFSVDTGAFTPFTNGANWTPLANTNRLEVEIVGGGGGGGGLVAQGVGQYGAGSGGQSGAYAKIHLYPYTLGPQSITVGAGGTAVAGASGNSGGNSAFGSIMNAAGGGGGNAGLPFNNTVAFFNPYPSVMPQVTISSSPGSVLSRSTSNATGGIGISSGGNINLQGGSGGSSPIGQGGAGHAASAGESGQGFGAGGGAAAGQNFGAATAGGVGIGGAVIVREYA